MEGPEPQLAALLISGIIAGLWLLVRGMHGYRTVPALVVAVRVRWRSNRRSWPR